jgi:MFS family permease
LPESQADAGDRAPPLIEPMSSTPSRAPSHAPTLATLPLTLLLQAASSAATIAPAVAAPALRLRLDVGPVAVGIYIALVYLTAMASAQWGAALVKRWGPIRTSQIALAFSAVGLMLMTVPNLAAAFVGALFLGFGYGPITPASSEILARTTPPERYALVFSVKQTGVPVGGVLAGLLVPTVLEHAGPVWAMAQIAALSIAGALMSKMLRGELDTLRDPRAPLPTLARFAQPMRFVWSRPVLRMLSLCSLTFSVVQVCATSYLVSFLTHDLRWTLVAAGVSFAAAQIGGVVGRVIWGLIADRLGEARSTFIGLALAMLSCGLAMPLLGPSVPHVWVTLLLIAFGASAIGWNGVFLATVARLVPIEDAAKATSGSLFFTYFGVVVGPPLFGAAGDAMGTLGPSFALTTLPLAWSLWRLWNWKAGRSPSM